MLQAKDFYSERAGWVFEGIKAMSGAVDHITVFHELVRQGHAQAMDRPRAYLSYLISVVPTPFLAEHYARIVKDMAERRRVIVDAGQKAGEAWEGRASSREFKGFSVEP